MLGFAPSIGPALLTDLMLLFDKLGMKSGLSGSVLDMPDSSQNNKREQEMASVKVIPMLGVSCNTWGRGSTCTRGLSLQSVYSTMHACTLAVAPSMSK